MTPGIPEQLEACQFNRVLFKQKKAFEGGWQNKPYTYEEIQNYFPLENYGVICNEGLRVLDDDTPDKKLIDMFIELFGETFRVRDHLYFRFDNGHSKKIILNNGEEHLGEIQGENTYVVGAGSTHPSGEIYEVKNDANIITIPYKDFEEYFGEFTKGNQITRAKADTSEYDEQFVQGIKDSWVEGKRQDLCMSIAGYLRKELRYGFSHTLEVIKRLCEVTDDKDYEERAASVQATYLKDEEQVKGYSGLVQLGVITEPPQEEKEGIIWTDSIPNWTVAKKKSYIESKSRGELVLFSHSRDVIKGKPNIFDDGKKISLTLITVTEKKDKETEEIKETYKFIGEPFDKRYEGQEKEYLSKHFWVYEVVDKGEEYIVLMDEKTASSEVQFFSGMKIQVHNSNEISTDLKCKGTKTMFLCKSYEPTIKALPKGEIIKHTQDFMADRGFTRKLLKEFFFDLLFTHEDGNIYRQPEDYMLMRHAQLLSGKVNSYPLSTLSLGVPGCSKTMEIECIDEVFREGVMEAGNSTPKSLVPSFKEKPASPGHIMAANRVALIDELLKMVDNQVDKNGSTSTIKNQLGQLNYLLEHKKRSVGSGNNNSFTGQTTAKTILVGNPAGRMTFLSEHIKVLDSSTLSRLFIWVKGFGHKKFVQNNEVIKSPDTYTSVRAKVEKSVLCERVFGDFIYEFYLTIYDSCQVFTCDIDYKRLNMLYTTALALVPVELKNVWAARGRHHTELIIDGITKWNRIFVQQKDDFVAHQEDYDQAERILVKMANSWSEGLREQV